MQLPKDGPHVDAATARFGSMANFAAIDGAAASAYARKKTDPLAWLADIECGRDFEIAA